VGGRTLLIEAIGAFSTTSVNDMSYPIYQASGAVPLRTLPLAAACVAMTIPAAALYAWLSLRLPAVITLFASFAFAFVLAGAVKRLCAAGKVRNPRWIGKFAILLGLCGWYFQWAAWLVFGASDGPSGLAAFGGAIQMALHPTQVAGHLLEIASLSAGLGRYVMVGAWIGELWVLLFFPHYVGKMRAEAVFDEAAGEWAQYVELPNRFKLVDQPILLCRFDAPEASLAKLLVPEPDEGSTHYSRLRMYRLRGSDPLVSIVTVEIKGEDGAERVIERWPGKYLYVPAAELDELLARTAQCPEALESDPPELAGAIDRLQAGEFEAAYDAALPFVAAQDVRLYCDANRLCAISCSQTGKWPQAVAYWQALFSKEETAHNALQVATSAVMANETGQGAAWFEKAQAINASSREMPSIAILTNMLSALTAAQQHGAAMPYLEQLKGVYTGLHVTDPTFLFGHRVPLFHVFLEKSGAIVNQVLGMDESRKWFASMLPHLDERGKAELTQWLDRENAAA
jgi:hypothetical protein